MPRIVICVVFASTGLPPDLEAGGREVSKVKLERCPAVAGWPGLCRNGGGTCKTPWRLTRGKRFPSRFRWAWGGELHPSRHSDPRGRVVSKADGRGAAPGSGLRRRGGVVTAGLQSESGHFVRFVADL